MATISFGSEDEKIGLGFELFNTTGKEEMSYDDFCRSYEQLILNWSLLLGEKVQPDKKVMSGIFQQIDRRAKGIVNKTDYVEALKEDPYLFNWFNFFSNLEEHFRKKVKSPSMMEEHFGIELELIKAIKSFKEINNKVQQVLKMLDPNYCKNKKQSPLWHTSIDRKRLRPIASPNATRKFTIFAGKSFRPSPEFAKEVSRFEESAKIPAGSPFLLPSPANNPTPCYEEDKSISFYSFNFSIENKCELEDVPEVSSNGLKGSILYSNKSAKEEQVTVRIIKEKIDTQEKPIASFIKVPPVSYIPPKHLESSSEDDGPIVITDEEDNKVNEENSIELPDESESELNTNGAVGELLKSNPLARAVWYAPQASAKENSGKQEPAPIKEVSDEGASDEKIEQGAANISDSPFPKKITLISKKSVRRENSPKKLLEEVKCDGDKLSFAVKLLDEVVELSQEQAEALSTYMNEFNAKEHEQANDVTEKISHVKLNVPKIPFTKNKVLKRVEARSGKLVMYAHNNFALVANMMLGIKKAVDSVLEYPEVRREDFQVISKFYIVPWAVLNDTENTTKFKNCKFIDYAPQVFYNLRRIFRIKPQEYTHALGPQQLLVFFFNENWYKTILGCIQRRLQRIHRISQHRQKRVVLLLLV
eukprot:TRINITY_DN71682_c0_g1_i1.p1 TRINITY_DN71682_c0_g1~~TRINITY_DN71682_c0_g1_i1.p1  ORF type:complete len:646 (+),score=88.02 TRINITY_DN71682_c0_g1_i1:2028-3965(+)